MRHLISEIEKMNLNADKICMSVPLFIRVLEWAREECKSDVELHSAVEKIIKMNRHLEIKDYDKIVK